MLSAAEVSMMLSEVPTGSRHLFEGDKTVNGLRDNAELLARTMGIRGRGSVDRLYRALHAAYLGGVNSGWVLRGLIAETGA